MCRFATIQIVTDDDDRQTDRQNTVTKARPLKSTVGQKLSRTTVKQLQMTATNNTILNKSIYETENRNNDRE